MPAIHLWQAIVLGLVQGLAEFLPVSSSAHLILIPWFFGWSDPGLAFDVALHLGTLGAIIVFFWKDLVRLFFGFCRSLRKLDLRGDSEQRLAWLLVLASIPGAAAGLFLEKDAETVFRNPAHIAIVLILLGIILFYADRFGKRKTELEKLNFKNAIIIGLAQAAAVVPGVSRSGATISAGLFLGLNREAAARFSFLLSVPIVAGAGLVKISEVRSEIFSPVFLAGFAASILSGYLAIALLLQIIRKRSYNAFVFYRIALGVLILTLILIK